MVKKGLQDRMVAEMLRAGLVKHPDFEQYAEQGWAVLCDEQHTFTLTNTGKTTDWTWSEF